MQHNRNSPIVTAVADWWKSLHHPDRGDRGARARLKRCDSVLDALLEPETHSLISRVREKATISHALAQKLAILALILARVKPSEKAAYTFADTLGRTRDDGNIPKDDARPRLSPMRFSTLLRAGKDASEDADKFPDEFARILRRTLAILGDTPFNVRCFIGDVLFFDDQTRLKWTFEYYHTRRDDTANNAQSQEETQL